MNPGCHQERAHNPCCDHTLPPRPSPPRTEADPYSSILHGTSFVGDVRVRAPRPSVGGGSPSQTHCVPRTPRASAAGAQRSSGGVTEGAGVSRSGAGGPGPLRAPPGRCGQWLERGAPGCPLQCTCTPQEPSWGETNSRDLVPDPLGSQGHSYPNP